VAEFSPSELDVTVHENTLLVTGKVRREEEKKRTAPAVTSTAASRGAFERRFSLADDMQVTGAKLDSGMLHVDLVHQPEAAKPR